eukprot:378245-Prymnesium_polylepis.2
MLRLRGGSACESWPASPRSHRTASHCGPWGLLAWGSDSCALLLPAASTLAALIGDHSRVAAANASRTNFCTPSAVTPTLPFSCMTVRSVLSAEACSYAA